MVTQVESGGDEFANPGKKLFGAEGLGDEILGPQRKSSLAVGVLTFGRKEHNGQLATMFQMLGPCQDLPDVFHSCGNRSGLRMYG